MPLPDYVQQAIQTQQEPMSSGLPDYVQQAIQQPQQEQFAPPQQQSLLQSAESVIGPMPDRSFSDPKYWTGNVPLSAARAPVMAAVGMGGMVYDAAKQFTDPVVNALSGKESIKDAAYDLFHAPFNAVKGVVNGLADFTAAPFGLSDKTTAKEAWNDPAMALSAVIPVGIAGGKMVGAALPKEVPLSLTKKSLRFSPAVEPEVQARVAKTMLDEGATTTIKSYYKFTQKIKDQAAKVWDLIAPVAKDPVTVNLEPARQKALEWADTSTDRSKNTKKINAYLDQFSKDHPTLTVEQAQKIKVNLNTDLNNYYKAFAKGDRVKVSPVIKAKEQLMTVLRDEINKAAPGTAEINKNLSDLIATKPFLKVAMNKSATRPIFGPSDYHAGVIGASIGTTLGGWESGGKGATVGMIGSRVLTDQRLQSGTAQVLHSIASIPGKIKNLIPEREATKIAAELEQQLQLPPGQNQLALPEPGKPIQMGDTPTSPIPMGGPAVPGETFRKPNSWERLFQIAQSPEGKKLLLEHLGREEKHARLMQELMKVPDQLALPGPGARNLLEDTSSSVSNRVQNYYLNHPQPYSPQVKVYKGGKQIQ